jgi:actin-related protein 3
MNELV